MADYLPPSGVHEFTAEIGKYGLSVDCRCDYTVYPERIVIDDVQVWDFEAKRWAHLSWMDDFACKFSCVLIDEARKHEEAMREKVRDAA